MGSRRARSSKPFAAALPGLLVCFAALLLFRLLEAPAEPQRRLCGFLTLTGLPCPLCGMIRALCALAKGRWGDAIRFHALSPLVFAILAGAPLTLAVRAIAPLPRLSEAARARCLLVLAGLFLAYGAGRIAALTL